MHYNYEYFEKTSQIDMSNNYNFFFKYFEGRTILDLGCGSGRDSHYFIKQNYMVCSVDNSEHAKQFAKRKYNIDVDLMDIEQPIGGAFDGIWSCASLVHMNKEKIHEVLSGLKNNLTTNGIIYISLKYGEGTIESNNQIYYLYNESLVEDLISFDYQVLDMKISQNNNPMNSWIEFIIQKS